MHSCYIIDDEPIAIDIIRHYLAKLDGFELRGSFEEPLDAFRALKEEPVSLIFLDIQMPGLSGLEMLRALNHRPAVILTTAHREYALDGFDLDVVDYLLKPIEFQRFLQSIDKYLNRQPQVGPADMNASQEYILVRANRKSIQVKLSDILFIEGLKDYVKIILPEKTILTKVLIGDIEQQLPSSRFCRVHRSFIVARDKIDAFTAMDVEIGEKGDPHRTIL